MTKTFLFGGSLVITSLVGFNSSSIGKSTQTELSGVRMINIPENSRNSVISMTEGKTAILLTTSTTGTISNGG